MFRCRCRIELFGVGSESVDGVEGGVVSAFNKPEGFLLQSFKIVERVMYNNANIIAKMRHNCFVPPIPSKMPWNMLSMPMVESLAHVLLLLSL